MRLALLYYWLIYWYNLFYKSERKSFFLGKISDLIMIERNDITWQKEVDFQAAAFREEWATS